jgi:hypothetical protein
MTPVVDRTVGWRRRLTPLAPAKTSRPRRHDGPAARGEAIGGQIGHPQLHLPRCGLIGVAAILVQPDHPFGGLTVAALVRHNDP